MGIAGGGDFLDQTKYEHMVEITKWPAVTTARSLNDLVEAVKDEFAHPLPEAEQHTLRGLAMVLADCRPGLQERIAVAIEAAR